MQANILIVDDEDDYRKFLTTVLSAEGYTVSGAANSHDALQVLRKQAPQLIILDLILPGLSGDHLLRLLKADPTLSEIPVLIITAIIDVEARNRCEAHGADGFLAKPFDLADCLKRVHRLLSKGTERSLNDSTSQSMSASEEEKTSTGPLLASTVKRYGIYAVQASVGKGAMGQVYKGYDQMLERDVAIKILSEKLAGSPKFVERFRREAKLLASINHPGIAQIYSFGEQDGELYFAMQWCPGGSLAELIKTQKTLEVKSAVDLILQCAQALTAASNQGVVHRDIKPGNIMFDDNGHVKLVDFGIAFSELRSPHITGVSEVVGTPSYMAPEQAQTAHVDLRSDIYSLGITFYKMLYGKVPFSAKSSIDVLVKHASQPFPNYDSLGGKIPRTPYLIIEKMTRKDPAARYQDYKKLIEDLRRLEGEISGKDARKTKISGAIVENIAKKDYFELLSDIGSKKLSGILTAQWSGCRKRFVIQSGHAVAFESNQSEESIWRYMKQKGFLLEEEAPASPEDLLPFLSNFLNRNLFLEEDFSRCYLELMEHSLFQMFLWPEFYGEFRSSSIRQKPFGAVCLSNLSLRASRSVVSYSSIEADIPKEGQFRIRRDFDSRVQGWILTPEESFMLSRFEAPNLTFALLHAITGLPEERVLRFLFFLKKMGVIEVQDSSSVASLPMA